MREPQPLSAAISELITKRGLAVSRGNAEVDTAWEKAAGERIAGDSRVLFIRDGTVYIGVGSSALLNEIVSFHSQRLLMELQTECAELALKKLRFQLKTNK